MHERYLRAWFLAQEGIGARALERVHDYFGSLEDFYRADRDSWRDCGAFSDSDIAKLRHSLTEEKAEEYRLRLNQKQVEVLINEDDTYPELLSHIPDPPKLLYVRGDMSLLSDVETTNAFKTATGLTVAVVGSRRATQYGRRVAKEIARDLAEMGITIVSGLASGIDSMAHRGALAATIGKTFAVTGSGIDVTYPKENTALAEEICQRGLIFSEYPLGTAPLPSNFPRRNRIISGLSLGVLVVEATEQSGTQVTVGYALEQGREVFAVPGNIYSAASRGPHRLLKSGARLVESADDILEELGLLYPTEDTEGLSSEVSHPLSLLQQRVLDLLEAEPRALDHLQAESKIPVGTLLSELLQLQLLGLVDSLPGKQFIKTGRT